MGSAIYVRPVTLLEALYRDLQVGNKAVRGLRVWRSTEAVEGDELEKVEIVFDFCSRLSRSGRINIQVAGVSKDGVIEAEKKVVAALFEALRTEHHICIADFNYIVISETRDRYNAMRRVLHDFTSTYDNLEKVLKECQSLFVGLLCDLSRFVGDSGVVLKNEDDSVVDHEHVGLNYFYEYHARVSHYTPVMDLKITRARRLVQTTLDHDFETEEQRRLDLTAPMPMIIEWDRSFSVLQTLFSQAMKTLNLNVSGIRVVQLSDGQFEATLDMFVDPYCVYGPGCPEEDAELFKDPRSFTSAPYPSEVGSKAKVIYEALKYVRSTLSLAIIDLNYELQWYQQEFRANFAAKVNDIWGCGSRLKGVVERCEEVYRRCTGDLCQSVAKNEGNRRIFDAIANIGTRLTESQVAFARHWGDFTDQKNVMVDRGFVDAFVFRSF